MRINTQKFLRHGKSLILAYDQGLEHGPTDFNQKNLDPSYILDIALESHFSGIILHHGIAEKYYHGHYRDVPLIIKLNGKTKIEAFNPAFKDTCTVERAAKLGASAIGYTLFDGNPVQDNMFEQFGAIVDRAHDYGMPVFTWVYPRGIHEKGVMMGTDILAYVARVALEFGADFIKMKYNDDHEGFKWVVQNAGKAKVLIAGGDKMNEPDFLKRAMHIMETGVSGLAVGRNVWQSPDPYKLSKALSKVVFEGVSAKKAAEHLQF